LNTSKRIQKGAGFNKGASRKLPPQLINVQAQIRPCRVA